MNLTLVEQATPQLVDAGHRLFQMFRFAPTEREHIARLLGWAELPDGARVIDLGCGTGEMVRVMHAIRPDLLFTLVNLSPVQLAYADPAMPQHCEDFDAVSEGNGTFDAAFLCFALGHSADRAKTLCEAHRLLKAGGILFIVDMVRWDGDGHAMQRLVEYTVDDAAAIPTDAVGFRLDFTMKPEDYDGYGVRTFGASFYDIFAGVDPAVWRFIKC